jgi:hypothetical protein
MLPALAIADDRAHRSTTRTGDQGRFRFEGVPVGPYVLRSERDGLHGRLDCAAVLNNEDEILEVVLRESKPEKEFIIVVEDASGQPVPKAEVAFITGVRNEGVFGMGDRPALGGVTDEQGRCSVQHVTLESGIVRVRASGGREAWAIAHHRFGFDGPVEVRVVLDEPGSLDGRVLGVNAGQVEGALVQAHALSSHSPYGWSFGWSYETPVRGGGYVFEHLPAGTYSLTLRSESGLRLVLPLMRAWKDHRYENSVEPATAEVVAGVRATRDLEVMVGGAIVGRVVATGRAPVANAEILAILAPRTSNFPDGFYLHGRNVWRLDAVLKGVVDHPEAHRRVRTDTDGRYRLAGLHPGKYRVEVFAEGLSYEQLVDVEVKDKEDTLLKHRLEPAGVLQGTKGTGGYLGVTRVGETAPAMLMILPSDGFFTLPGLAAGEYDVAAFHSDEGRAPALLGRARVLAGKTTWLDLRDRGPVKITAFVADDAGPASGIRVRTFQGVKVTDAAGQLTIHTAFPWTGNVLFWVAVDGLEWMFVFPGMSVEQKEWTGEVRLGRHSVTIQTVDAEGSPLPAKLWLGPVGFPSVPPYVRVSSPNVSTGPRGEVTFSRFLEGEYQLGVTLEGGLGLSRTFRVPLGDPIVVAAPPTGRLEVKATDQADKPVAGVMVIAHVWKGGGEAPDDLDRFRNEAWHVQAATDTKGRATLQRVPVGEVLLERSMRARFGFSGPDGLELDPLRFHLEAGQTKDIPVSVRRK